MSLWSTRDSHYFPCFMDWSWGMKRSRGMKSLGAPIAESDLGFGSWGSPPNTATMRPPQVPQNLWTFFFYPMAGMELSPSLFFFFLSSTHPFSGNENKYSKAYRKKSLKSYPPEGFSSSKRKGCFARLLTLNELSLILPPTHWGPHQLDTWILTPPAPSTPLGAPWVLIIVEGTSFLAMDCTYISSEIFHTKRRCYPFYVVPWEA